MPAGPPLLKLTRAGGIYIGLTLLLGFAAVNTGNNLLYLIVAALLAFMATTGVIGKRNIERVTLEVEPPEEVYAGVDTLLRIRLTNQRRWLPGFLLHAEVDENRVLVPFLPCGSATVTTLLLRFPQRGRQQLATIRIASHFPVAFFRRARALRLDREVIVFPALRPLPGLVSDTASVRSGFTRHDSRRGAHGEIGRITDYTGSEPLKRIHWKLSARHDELKVTEREDLASAPVTIDPQQLPGRDLEERLSGAAWLLDRYLRAGRAVGLRLGTTDFAPAAGHEQKLRLLRALALYGRD